MVDFLDILGGNLEELVDANEISKDELAAGIQMQNLEEVLKGPEHFEEVFTSTIVKLMRDKNPKYDKDCEENGKTPEELPKLVLSKNGEKVSLCFEGNDGRSRIAITNRLSKEKSGVQEFSQEKFLSKAFNTLLSSRKEKAGTKVVISDNKLRDICDILAEGLVKPMSSFLNKYLSDRAGIIKEHYKEILQSMDNKPKIIRGRDVKAKTGEGTHKSGTTAITGIRIRKNPVMEGSGRYNAITKLQSNGDGDVIICFTEEKSGKDYKSYVIHTPDRGGGALMIIEPDVGKSSTKLIYFTKEDLKDKAEPEPYNPDLRDEFWKKKTASYAQMSRNDFINSGRCTTINHADEGNYINKITTIIKIMKGKRPHYDNNIYFPVKKATDKLLGITKTPNIKDVVGDVSPEELAAARAGLTVGKKEKRKEHFIGGED